MPTVKRSRELRADPDTVWDVLADPHQLPRWWPGVDRVEEVTPHAWTKVLRTKKGKPVRADFTRLEAQRPRRVLWRQELAESPFERFLSEATTEIILEPRDAATRVEMRAIRRLRGLSRFGGFMVRRAARKQLDEALEGLGTATEGRS